MKLSHIAILALKGTDADFRKRLAEVLGVSEPTIYRYINNNDDTLTKAAALQLIREVTGLTDDQILETEETVKA